MSRRLGVQIGLLAFGVAIAAGLYVGNSPTLVLMRALMAMVIGVFIGQAAGWAGKVILREHLQRIKLRIDREHLAAIEALSPPPLEEEGEIVAEAAPEATPPPEAG